MRIMRLIRLVKLFKHWGGQQVGSRETSGRLSRFSAGVKQSHVGQKLSELTTRRVVLGVLTMVLVLPFLDVTNSVYGNAPRLSDTGLHTLHALAVQDNTSPLFLRSLMVRLIAARVDMTLAVQIQMKTRRNVLH
jgi:hypothetical protein